MIRQANPHVHNPHSSARDVAKRDEGGLVPDDISAAAPERGASIKNSQPTPALATKTLFDDTRSGATQIRAEESVRSEESAFRVRISEFHRRCRKLSLMCHLHDGTTLLTVTGVSPARESEGALCFWKVQPYHVEPAASEARSAEGAAESREAVAGPRRNRVASPVAPELLHEHALLTGTYPVLPILDDKHLLVANDGEVSLLRVDRTGDRIELRQIGRMSLNGSPVLNVVRLDTPGHVALECSDGVEREIRVGTLGTRRTSGSDPVVGLRHVGERLLAGESSETAKISETAVVIERTVTSATREERDAAATRAPRSDLLAKFGKFGQAA